MSTTKLQLFYRVCAVGYAGVGGYLYGELRSKTTELALRTEFSDEKYWPDGRAIKPSSRMMCALASAAWPITVCAAGYL